MEYELTCGDTGDELAGAVYVMLENGFELYGYPFSHQDKIYQAFIIDDSALEDIECIPDKNDKVDILLLKYFRRPQEYEDCYLITTNEIASIIREKEKSFSINKSTIRHLGRLLTQWGFPSETLIQPDSKNIVKKWRVIIK